MKLTVDRKALAAALKTVTRATPRVLTLPVLAGVHISAEPGHLRLTGSDLDLTIETYLDAQVGEPGEAVIPARVLTGTVDKLAGDTVEITCTDHDATITCGRAVATLRTLAPTEWPRLVSLDEPVATLGEAQLHDLKRVLPFVSTDQPRTNIIGVAFNDGDLLATDSYRGVVVDWGVTLPEPAYVHADAIAAVLASGVGDLELCVNDTHMAFRSPTTTWTVRQLGVEPAQLKRMFRSSSEHRITFDAGELAGALDRLRPIEADAARPVRIAIADGVATLSRTSDIGTMTDEVDVEGDLHFEIAYNVSFLASAITAAEVDRITFDLVDALKPAQVEAGRLRVLIMPVRTN